MKRALAIAIIVLLGAIPIAAAILLTLDAQKDLKP